MKNKVIFFCILLSALSSFAQSRKIERSSRKRPDWVNGIEKNYLIVSATGTNIEDAKNKITLSIRQQMIEAIASTVSSDITFDYNYAGANSAGQVKENYNSHVKSSAAKIAYLNEVSLANAEDFYWEKKTSNNLEECFYCVKYPFSQTQLQRLVMDFKLKEAEIDFKLDEITSKLSQINSLKDINNGINELKALKSATSDNDFRRGTINEYINRFLQLYNLIQIQESNSPEGKIRIILTLADQLIISETPPKVKSSCADRITMTPDDAGWIISYDDYPCKGLYDNYIEVKFRINNQNIQKRFYIDKQQSI